MNEPREFLKKNDLPWVQGWLGDWSTSHLASSFGIDGIPASFLIGPDGKVIESDLKASAIVARLQKHLAKEVKP
jgi:predicted polyphosphate/ATP-dependent NAD kinase